MVTCIPSYHFIQGTDDCFFWPEEIINVNILIALFQFLYSGWVLVELKQACIAKVRGCVQTTVHGAPAKQLGYRWSGKDVAQFNINTFRRSFYATIMAAPHFPFTFIFLMFLESCKTNLFLKCSRPSSLSTSPCFALCFWTCTYFT